MSTSTVQTIFNGLVDTLVSYWTTLLPIIVPVVIGAAVLFGAIALVRSLAHRK